MEIYQIMKLKKLISSAMLLVAAIIWGFAFVAQDSASNVPAFTLGMARSYVATAFLLIIIIVFDKVKNTGRRLVSRKGIDFTRTELVGGVICGIFLTAASAFQQIGINSGTDGGKAAFITAMYVVLVPIYSLFLGKKAPINIWFSVGIAAVGFYLLCIGNDLSVQLSDMLVVCAALLFPLHILTIDRFSPKCDGVRMSAIQFLTAGILNTILSLIFESPVSLESVANNIGAVLFLGIGSSGIAYTLQILGQNGVNPSAASILLSLESVFGVIGVAIILHKTLITREYIGCLVVFIAVILSQIDFKAIRNKKIENKGLQNGEKTQ